MGRMPSERKGLSRRDALGTVTVALALALVAGVGLSRSSHGSAPTGAASAQAAYTSGVEPADTGWTVGELRADGLRIIPSGRSDAAAVLDPEQFENAKVRNAYRIATQIPEVLNQLYCWCGCENRGVHRSNLQCFEDRMGVNCDVCQGTAEIAYDLVQNGITDAGEIQATVDAQWAPPGARVAS